jgi:hypothetical protein
MMVWAVGSLSFAAVLVIIARATTLTQPSDMPQAAPELASGQVDLSQGGRVEVSRG